MRVLGPDQRRDHTRLAAATAAALAFTALAITGCRDDGAVEALEVQRPAIPPVRRAELPLANPAFDPLKGEERVASDAAAPRDAAAAEPPRRFVPQSDWAFRLEDDRRRLAGRAAARPMQLVRYTPPAAPRRPTLDVPSVAAAPVTGPAIVPQPVPNVEAAYAPPAPVSPTQLALAPAARPDAAEPDSVETEAPDALVPVPSARPFYAAPEPAAEPEPPVQVASLNPTEPLANHNPPPRRGGLRSFHAELAALRSGRRTRPVTILHIGDSHVASDSFSRGIRKRLQATYGDAGRGAIIPPKVFPYAAASGVSMSRKGKWTARYSLKHKAGPYGVSGVRISASSRRASMTLTSRTGSFDHVEVMILTGPKRGGVTIQVGSKKKTFSARGREGSKLVRLEARGKTAVVRPAGRGTTTILHWGVGRAKPGVRYVNFGLVGATVNVTKRWDPKLVANDIRALKPDLIVYGYGTNEGFNAGVNLDSYRAYATRFVRQLQRAAPEADIAFIGAADGASRRHAGSRCAGGYRTPVKLGGVRRTVRSMAKELGAGYWDWAGAMGGRCSVDKWARKGLAAKDRVHLTNKGYDRSASMFVSQLLSPKAANRRLVADR